MQIAPSADYIDVTHFPALRVRGSWLFCDPTRLFNTYEPSVYRIWEKPFLSNSQDVTSRIHHGIASPPEPGRLGRWNRLAARLESLRYSGCLDLGERLAYDARGVDNSNMAHLIHRHLAMLAHFHERSGFGSHDVTVLLQSRGDTMAREVFSLAGYQTIETLRPVRCNQVTVDYSNFMHLLPAIRHLNIEDWVEDGPKRIFISRRNTRRLTNERAIMDFLRARGFETVYFEEIPILKQWSWVRGAKRVVAIHGAALGCLAFQATRDDGPAADLVELFTPGFVVNPYREYQAALGGRWVGCRGRLTPSVIRNVDNPRLFKAHAFDDFHLAIETLDEALQWLDTADSPPDPDSGEPN